MGPVRQNPIQRTVSLFICVCIALCTIVAHNIAPNRPDSFPPYPPDRYYGNPMQEESNDYTTFVCSRGLMRFKVMPFSMVNSGSTYNRMIRKLLYGSHNLESCVDDVLGHTENWSKHMEILRDFFQRVRKANLCLRPSKCKIGFDQVKFLGHTLQGDCIKPQDESVGRIPDTERPKTKKSCRSLLGMINFYRRYIPNCAEVIAPLTDLTKNRAPNNVQWGEEQMKSDHC